VLICTHSCFCSRLKILSVSHKASSGLALVAGYDISSQEIAVVERLGNCPQFDVVWPKQSVQRHLEYFANLKGLPRDQIKEIAHSFASAVGLGAPEVYHRAAGSLSGGMRRRLSIATSLIGAPNVLLLDGEFQLPFLSPAYHHLIPRPLTPVYCF
jgi:ABC-type multidrug transport system ATPase subunit